MKTSGDEDEREGSRSARPEAAPARRHSIPASVAERL
jgi:hypothetical protein